jgi:predicted Rossmann fold nucleotide-binding protein DprA/Smf involved in DNA uptake
MRLLERSGRMALELENIFSRGMWVVTRMDELYPAKLRETLKLQAPTVLFGAGDVALLTRGGVAVIGSRVIDEGGTLFVMEAGRKIAASGVPVISGRVEPIACDGRPFNRTLCNGWRTA